MNEIPNLNNKNIVVKIRFDVLRFFIKWRLGEIGIHGGELIR